MYLYFCICVFSGVLDRHPRLVWLFCLPPRDGLLRPQAQAEDGQIKIKIETQDKDKDRDTTQHQL